MAEYLPGSLTADERHRRHLLLVEVEKRRIAIEAALARPDVRRLCADFAHKSPVGRARALKRLKWAFAAADFRAVRLSPPLAIWSFCKLRTRNEVEEWPDIGPDPGDRQGRLVVYNLAAGQLGGGLVWGSCSWRLELALHTAGRICGAWKSAVNYDVLELITKAHETLLCASAEFVLAHRAGFLLPVGDEGRLLCKLDEAADGSLYVVARGWLIPGRKVRGITATAPMATNAEDQLAHRLWPRAPVARSRAA
jgi:hypothetical protein